MSEDRSSRVTVNLKPFGDTTNPHGFYCLLLANLTWLATHNFSQVTVDKRGLYVRAFALWCLEADLPSPLMITKSILEAFQRHLFRYRKPDGQPLAWSSQHLHLKEVKQFFSWLAKHNHIPFSPAAEIELPKQPKTLPKAILLAEEVELILQQPDTTTALGLRDRDIFEVLYSTGIRRYGRRYIKSASINKPGACHIFRHTMATLMHDAGADIRTIQEILGHAKLDTTQIYTRVSLKKLLETHQMTHPAEQPDKPDQPPSHSPGKPSSSQQKINPIPLDETL